MDFIWQHLPSVEHLRVFMVLESNRHRFWSAAEVAAQLRLADDVTASVLEQLAVRNLMDVRISDALLYRFKPATPMLEAIASRAAEHCRHDPLTVFANSFPLRLPGAEG